MHTHEIEQMCVVAKGPNHGPAPIPQEGRWTKAKEVTDISGLTHGVGWCAPQQGACKLTLNVKKGIIEEALVETIGCTGMTHSAAMAAEILPGKTILEALNTDLVCDAINVAMRELFLQIVYGRTQTAFQRERPAYRRWIGRPGQGAVQRDRNHVRHQREGRALSAIGRGLRNRTGARRGQRDHRLQVCPPWTDDGRHRQGCGRTDRADQATGTYGRFADAVKTINPRKE